MKLKGIQRCVTTIVLLLACAPLARPQISSDSITKTDDARPQPLILEKNEGELRTRRLHTDKSTVASSQFLLKVSPKNNGSQHLVAGTETILPGARIAKHKHLIQDEILIVDSGKARVFLGEREADVEAGAMVFIPSDTWISLKNTGTEPVNVIFVFSAPGFEETMRCNSVPANEKPTPLTAEQRKECGHLGHAVSAGESD